MSDKVFYSFLIVLFGNTLFGQLNPQFTTVDGQSGCSPLAVSFVDQSTGGATSWLWDFGNGNTSTLQNPSALYLNPGTYTVSLTISNGGNSATSTETNYITVFREPEPNFTFDNDEGCAPLTVNFNENTVLGDANIVSYIWDFGDGNTSFDQNPAHIYSIGGLYDVTLVVEDANGCSNVIKLDEVINVFPQPNVSFNASPRYSCTAPLEVNFTNTSNGQNPLTYEWDFGDGNTSTAQEPTHVYTNSGSYDVQLVVTAANGCKDTLRRNSFIRIDVLNADFEMLNAVACVGQEVQFNDISTPANVTEIFNWDFGDGNTSNQEDPTHTYSNSGTYDITLTVEDNTGCSSTITIPNFVTVLEPPVSDFSPDQTSSCQVPFQVSFTNNSVNGDTYEWDFGDGNISSDINPIHIYTDFGNYNVSLITTSINGCMDTILYSNLIQIQPIEAEIMASPFEGCVPLDVDFSSTNTSLTAIVSYEWNFGDGNTSISPNPSNTYVNEGVYNVSLIIVNAEGCRDTVTTIVQTGEKPQLGFTNNPLISCAEDPIIFTNTSIGATEWYWEFGDGSMSTEQDPTHVYVDTGWMNVTLVGINNGCTDTLIIDSAVYIIPPIVSFIPVQDCQDPFTVDFVTNSIGADTWTWDFGDGNSSNLEFPTHTYAGYGTYDVSVVVTNDTNDCRYNAEQTVVIEEFPEIFSGTPRVGCAPLIVQFQDLYFLGEIISWEWHFGDGTISNDTFPEHIYPILGVYDVTLIVEKITGCRDTTTYLEYINVVDPIAAFEGIPTRGCNPLTVEFLDTSNFNATEWYWDFGDGNTSIDENPTHIYDMDGTYSVFYRATDSTGCVDSIFKRDYIVVSSFNGSLNKNSSSTCSSEPIRFRALPNDNVLYTYFWNFGDGTTSAIRGPDHTFPANGVYPIELEITDTNGCIQFYYDTITVLDPVADFTADPTEASCPPLLVNFTDTSNDIEIANWIWDFGDGSTGTGQNPSHVYTEAGIYDVTLIIVTRTGCRDTIFKPELIKLSGPFGQFVINPPEGCAPHTVDYSLTSVNGISFIWDYGDGIVERFDTVTNLLNISHTYIDAGEYIPRLIIEDGQGCSYAVPPPDTIIVGEITPLFSAEDTIHCESGSIQFTDESVGFPSLDNWEWNFGDGNTSTLQNPNHTYNSSGVYDVNLIVSNDIGCIDTFMLPNIVRLVSNPIVGINVNPQEACVPSIVEFFNNTQVEGAIDSLIWYFGDGDSSFVENPTHEYTTAGTFTVTLFVMTEFGCADESSLEIIIHPLPIADAGTDQDICAETTTQLFASGGVTYEWTPSTYLSCTDCRNPFCTPENDIEYIVRVTDENGCEDIDTVQINVIPNPILVLTNDAEICEGDSIQLEVISNQTISEISWTATRLTCYDCPNPTAFPDETTLYYVEVTDNQGCIAIDSVLITVRQVPLAQAYGDTLICRNDDAQIGVFTDVGTIFNWSPANSLNDRTLQNPIASPVVPTTYYVTVSNGFCESYDTIDVDVTVRVRGEVEPGFEICVGDTVQLEASGGQSYVWSPTNSLNNPNISNPLAFPRNTTTYSVTISAGSCLPDIHQVNVIVNDLPIVDAGEDKTILTGQSVTLEPNGNQPMSYVWDEEFSLSCDSCRNPDASPIETTTYWVTGTNNKGCQARDSVTINVISSCNGDAVWVPNAFTPNGDNQNDKLFVRGTVVSEIEVFRVFNRWGELMFETNDISEGWDGRYKGQLLQPAVYVYYVEAICVNGEKTLKKGNVTLIR